MEGLQACTAPARSTLAFTACERGQAPRRVANLRYPPRRSRSHYGPEWTEALREGSHRRPDGDRLRSVRRSARADRVARRPRWGRVPECHTCAAYETQI